MASLHGSASALQSKGGVRQTQSVARRRLGFAFRSAAATAPPAVIGAGLPVGFSTAWGGDVNGSLSQFLTQLAAVAIAILFSGLGSLAIAWLVGLVTPLRARVVSEAQGLDVPLHGEEAYSDGEGALLIPVSTSAKAAQVAAQPARSRA